jgi:hypothetical protein
LEEERGYKYDVFISYPHEPLHRKWVEEIFWDLFNVCLTNSTLGRRPQLFIDTMIEPGDMWRATLREALARSRILVPIWSINYFDSEYCREECAIMLSRAERLGYSKQKEKGSLIVPIRFMDHEGYPAIANDFQQVDLREFSSIREKNGAKMETLHGRLDKWVNGVAKKIVAAPPWNPIWLTDEWLTEPVERFEGSKTLWPPNKIIHLEAMGLDDGEDDGEGDGDENG